ncbi:uncharacterized protein [Venturia canescens]|uniref:uncharacterized protein n=1 Tax=Venturia canescens TaxID=32260 RepID=UPI001C9C29C1|nr:uncharacterized protein LOC122411376 [Venturia canescens]
MCALYVRGPRVLSLRCFLYRRPGTTALQPNALAWLAREPASLSTRANQTRPPTDSPLVDIAYLAEQQQCESCSEPFWLAFIESELRRGLASTLSIRCNKCSAVKKVNTSRKTLGVEGYALYDVNCKAALDSKAKLEKLKEQKNRESNIDSITGSDDHEFLDTKVKCGSSITKLQNERNCRAKNSISENLEIPNSDSEISNEEIGKLQKCESDNGKQNKYNEEKICNQETAIIESQKIDKIVKIILSTADTDYSRIESSTADPHTTSFTNHRNKQKKMMQLLHCQSTRIILEL